MEEQIVVIGLGGFGEHIARELSRRGFIVLAIDKNFQMIEKIHSFVSRALIMDTTDEEALMELNWREINTAIIAIGDPNLEASVLTVALMKQLGIPRIIARASSELHGRVLHMVGAHEVINPEKDTALMLVNRIALPNIVDIRQVDEYNVISEFIPPASFVGQSLIQLDLRNRFNISVVAIKRRSVSKDPSAAVTIIANPQPQTRIEDKDLVVAIGSKDDFERLRLME